MFAVQDPAMVGQLQELQVVLTLEVERTQASPAMRLLDEVGCRLQLLHFCCSAEGC